MFRLLLFLLLPLLAGCVAPIGAVHSTPQQALDQIQGRTSSLRELSGYTHSVLRRYDQETRFKKSPDTTLQLLHREAFKRPEPGLLFALAELNYSAAERLRHSVKRTETRDARDYYLAAACYSYFYLFGENAAAQDKFDERLREACDIYNISLGWALTARRSTNSVALLQSGPRRMPFGQVDIEYNEPGPGATPEALDRFLLADHFVIHGFSVRNRQRGIGVPLIALGKPQTDARVSQAFPATTFLRLHGGLAELEQGRLRASLELHPGFGPTTIDVANQAVPLEIDWSVQIAYLLNQRIAWRLGRVQFLSGRERVPSNVYVTQPYESGRVPIVFVHGTMSTPVWWAEMVNALRTDPLVQQRCQIWLFVYNTGYPIPVSALKLRDSLMNKIRELDPNGKDPALQQMMLVGHSQGGLLAKLLVTETGDTLWRVISTNRIEDLPVPDEHRDLIRRYLFHRPLESIRRVVFIATPHRGSYVAGGFVRQLTAWMVTLPSTLAKESTAFLDVAGKVSLPSEFKRRFPASVDGMSPRNPVLAAMADLPPAPWVKIHSIIAVKGRGPLERGGDGVVKYSSAHINYADSECIVRCGHSCQGQPATIEEVRRIIHEHLAAANLADGSENER